VATQRPLQRRLQLLRRPRPQPQERRLLTKVSRRLLGLPDHSTELLTPLASLFSIADRQRLIALNCGQVERIVLGGSVVVEDYDWPTRFANGQVKYLRNYVAADDAVVAMFPRFFEPQWVRRLLHNDLGSAGFSGFSRTPPSGLENVRFVTGGHDAFLYRIGEIAKFLLIPDGAQASTDPLHAVPASTNESIYAKSQSAWMK